MELSFGIQHYAGKVGPCDFLFSGGVIICFIQSNCFFFFFFFPHITMRKFTDKMIKLENLESIIKFLCEVVHFRTYP